MTAMAYRCSICARRPVSDAMHPVAGLPCGWSKVTVAEIGRNVREFTLCWYCTDLTRARWTTMSEELHG